MYKNCYKNHKNSYNKTIIKHFVNLQAKFMVKYLSDTYGERATLGDRNLLDFLRDEAIRLQLLIV